MGKTCRRRRDHRGEAFYLGKLAAARFFARDVLPRVHSDRGIITHVDDSIMELPGSAF